LREELFPLIFANKTKPPPELEGIEDFLARHTHRRGGHPADADKTDFARFARTFRLPSEHSALLRLRRLADEVAEYWADVCLSKAEEGHGHTELKRLFDVASGTGVDPGHPKIVRAKRILNDRLAEHVLKDAEEREQRDARLESRGQVPRVGYASEQADKVEQAIFGAVAEGVPEGDPRLARASGICKGLRQRDGERKRLEGRRRRMEEAADRQLGAAAAAVDPLSPPASVMVAG